MVSYKLVVYCMVISGLYLLLTSLISEWLGRKLKLTRGVPEGMIEKTDLPGFVVNFLMELLFYVAIPTIAYTFFYMIIPLSGPQAGMAVTLIAFTLGAIPIMMVLSVRIKIPMHYILFLILSQLIKLGGSLIVIGYLYAL